MKRTAIISAVMLVLFLSAVLGWKLTRSEPKKVEETHDPDVVELSAEAQRNGGVAVAEVTDERMTQFVKMTGVIAPDESRVAHIVPLSQGVVEQVFVQLGNRVERGQPLLMYDNIELGESLGEFQNLRAELERARSQEQVAKRSLERAEALIEVQAISPRELELRKAEYQQAVANVASQVAQLARAEEKLHRFGMTDAELAKLDRVAEGSHRTASHDTLRAPLSGVVTQYEVSRGEVVGRDKELFTIVDTSTVWALADVYEKDIQFVSRGGECLVTVASYPKDVFKGTINYLSDALDPASRTAKLRCVLPNTDGRLKLEMFATVNVPTRESRTGVTVPSNALQDVGGQPVVFVQTKPDKFVKRGVQVGERTDKRIEIVSGLTAGERVVSDGSFYLKSALMRESIGGED